MLFKAVSDPTSLSPSSLKMKGKVKESLSADMVAIMDAVKLCSKDDAIADILQRLLNIIIDTLKHFFGIGACRN